MNPYCCDAMEQAIKGGYFYMPIGVTHQVTEDGKNAVVLSALHPSVQKKNMPVLAFAYCPFCGTKYKDTP